MAFVGFWMLPLAFFLSLFSPIIGFFETLMGLGIEEVALPTTLKTALCGNTKRMKTELS